MVDSIFSINRISARRNQRGIKEGGEEKRTEDYLVYEKETNSLTDGKRIRGGKVYSDY